MVIMQFTTHDIILYPTDTIYGLGVDATNPTMVDALKKLKGRDEGKAISIAVADREMLARYAEVTPLAEKLIDALLPGKLTLVLNVQGDELKALSNDGSIGIRIPAYEQVFALLREIGKPITATSANIAGMPTENTPAKILAQFGERSSAITQVIDVGELPPSAPSTVVDARGTQPIILREGALSEELIMSVALR
jgi:L-threonylcarbamoyladenylate synthase